MTSMFIKRHNLTVLLFFFIIFISSISFAGILDTWQDARAYKPVPVLFLHGFGRGNPVDWDSVKGSLEGYFSEYQPIGTYLETIDFQDPNGSIDRYDPGKFNPQGNSAGWSDKLSIKVTELLGMDKYGFYTNKLNLVCHSMGGLATRWYLATYSNSYIDKLILIGVPNKGSRWAELASITSKIPKAAWLNIFTTNGLLSKARNDVSLALQLLADIDIYGEAAYDMDPEISGSGFIANLNSNSQPDNISYYGIIGIVGNWMNWIAVKDYYGGDGVVSKDSQLGIGEISYEKWIEVKASHWDEIKAASGETQGNYFLSFLDSATPEFEITAPASGTEIYENSIRVQGRVYKEYFPADSTLTINVTRQEGGYNPPAQTSFLKPSDLWIPNNPDSPVAEFDETVNFPENGTYKLSLQIQNPAGLTSDIKDVWVKVNLVEGTNIIVHCHNPEDKEIASIEGAVGYSRNVIIYDGDILIGYGARSADRHNQPIPITPGFHTIKVKFNGTTKEQAITLDPNETKVLVFTFERTEYIIPDFSPINCSLAVSGTYVPEDPMSSSFKLQDVSAQAEGKVTFRLECTRAIDAMANYSSNISMSLNRWNWSLNFALQVTLVKLEPVSSANFFSSGAAYLDKDLGVIPATDDFDVWFIQMEKIGYFPINLALFDTINTAFPFTVKLHFILQDSSQIALGSSWNAEHSQSGSITNLKISSVPYDFTGSGI